MPNQRSRQSTATNGLTVITMDAVVDRVAAAAGVSAIAIGQNPDDFTGGEAKEARDAWQRDSSPVNVYVPL